MPTDLCQAMVGMGTPVALHLRLMLSPCLAVTEPESGIGWIEGGTETRENLSTFRNVIFHLEQ